MSSSGLSSLSSAPSTDDEAISNPIKGGSLDQWIKNGTAATPTPPKKPRPASPPHEPVLADNPDIAVSGSPNMIFIYDMSFLHEDRVTDKSVAQFIVMFRSRFSDAFPKSLPHYGPQDVEGGVVEPIPTEQIERLLCALLGLVLNRKKDVERGHFGRALEEAVQTHASQWPSPWNGKNPLHGGGNFAKMGPKERLTLLKTLIIWSLGSSETVQTILKDSYKQQRHDDDLNQPLSVQPWGRDGDKRRYWLIEGQDDTHFRLYRESNPALKHSTWRSVAGTIDEVKAVAERLGEDNSQASRRLRERITLAIPRFEASEEKRKRRDYRNARKAQFTRPDPGFSLYEGRTRGKRIRYTYSDEEEGGSDALSTRRSNRQSGLSTPAEPTAPTFTASGRQVRSRVGGTYGETMLTGQHDNREAPPVGGNDVAADVNEEQPVSTGRARRSASGTGVQGGRKGREHIPGYNQVDEMDDESDATSSGGEWEGGDDDVDEKVIDDEDDDDADMSDDEVSVDEEDEEIDVGKPSLVVSLRYHPDRPKESEDIHDLPNVNGVAQTSSAPRTAGQTGTTTSDVKSEGLTNGRVVITPASSFDTSCTTPSHSLSQMTRNGSEPQFGVRSLRPEETQTATAVSSTKPNSNVTLLYQSTRI